LLQDFKDINNTKIGFAISAMTTTGAIISFQYQKIRRRLSFQLVYAVSFLVLALGYYIISVSHGFSQIIPGLIISGLGLGLLMPNTNLWLLNSSPDHMKGRLIGGLSSSFFFGQFFSPIVAKPVIESSSMSAMFALYALFVFMLSLAFFLYHYLKRNSGKNLPNQPDE
jgi:MFS family permease